MSDARILDRRYGHYDGPRLGVAHAVGSVMRQTVQRCMGLHRPARWKLLPFLAVIIAYLPAITFVGLAALLPRRLHGAIPPISDYYGFVTAAITLFVLFVAPEALCPDRRSRVLSLYLASPLNRQTYLLAKVAAVMSILLLVTTGPPLLFLLGVSLQNAGPVGVAGFLGAFGRIAAAGLVLAAVYTALSLGVSSLTDRRAFASGATLLVLFGLGVVAGILHFGLGGPVWLMLLSVQRMPFELVQRIFGRPGFFPDLTMAGLIGAHVVYVGTGAAVCWYRYRSLQVTR
jgi:ABC-2 type transport system permease protein